MEVGAEELELGDAGLVGVVAVRTAAAAAPADEEVEGGRMDPAWGIGRRSGPGTEVGAAHIEVEVGVEVDIGEGEEADTAAGIAAGAEAEAGIVVGTEPGVGRAVDQVVAAAASVNLPYQIQTTVERVVVNEELVQLHQRVL